jgi:DinB family protein
MNRTATILCAATLAAASTVQAQTPANPLSANFKASWQNISGLLARMAEKMPEENYRFKPTPEMADFGARIAHAIGFNMRGCATAKGETKPLTFSAAPTKAEVLSAMKETNAYCDAVFNALTDADAMTMVGGGRGGPRPKFAILQGTVLEHSQEMYGYMAPYLRLKGIVPPSSDRNER